MIDVYNYMMFFYGFTIKKASDVTSYKSLGCLCSSYNLSYSVYDLFVPTCNV